MVIGFCKKRRWALSYMYVHGLIVIAPGAIVADASCYAGTSAPVWAGARPRPEASVEHVRCDSPEETAPCSGVMYAGDQGAATNHRPRTAPAPIRSFIDISSIVVIFTLKT